MLSSSFALVIASSSVFSSQAAKSNSRSMRLNRQWDAKVRRMSAHIAYLELPHYFTDRLTKPLGFATCPGSKQIVQPCKSGPSQEHGWCHSCVHRWVKQYKHRMHIFLPLPRNAKLSSFDLRSLSRAAIARSTSTFVFCTWMRSIWIRSPSLRCKSLCSIHIYFLSHLSLHFWEDAAT